MVMLSYPFGVTPAHEDRDIYRGQTVNRSASFPPQIRAQDFLWSLHHPSLGARRLLVTMPSRARLCRSGAANRGRAGDSDFDSGSKEFRFLNFDRLARSHDPRHGAYPRVWRCVVPHLHVRRAVAAVL